MERRVPRTVLVAAGLTVLALAGIHAGRERIAERWYIWRLRSAEEATRVHAAENLAAMKSVAAVPHLIDIMAGERRKRISYETALGSRGSPSIRIALLTPLSHALFSIGREALPALRAAIEAEPMTSTSGAFDPAATLIQLSWAIEGRRTMSGK